MAPFFMVFVLLCQKIPFLCSKVFHVMRKDKLITLLAVAIMASSCSSPKMKADLILHNATIYTVDENFSQAQAFAVKDGQFIACGSNNEILSRYESDNVIDAQGKPVYPGFMDGHSHFTSYGENLIRYADLKGCLSFDEVIERLSVHDSLYPFEWLLGRGWDQNLWDVPEFPDNAKLKETFPNRKVMLTRIDGHAVLASDEVLALAGLDENSKVSGGLVMVKDGHCTGILLDNAADIVKGIVPPMEISQKVMALQKAEANCFAAGLTSVTDAGLGIASIELIDSLQQSGQLKIHVNAMVNPDDETMDHFMKDGPIVQDRLTVRSVKIYADGALGSRGAKLLEPYTDAPETSGLMVCDDNFYHHVCDKAYQSGFQVCCHAIGDGGVRQLLNIYASHLGGANDRRWRMEHSQVVHPDDFQLYGQYNIIPSIQSTHCTSDKDWAGERLGEERIRNAYAYKRLLAQNGWVVNGTDFPIEHIYPLYTFYAAVSRKDLEGQPAGGFQPDDAFTREEALRSITIWAAKGCFMENRKGSIVVGKDADFVILNQDIMQAEESILPNITINTTFAAGEKVFER